MYKLMHTNEQKQCPQRRVTGPENSSQQMGQRNVESSVLRPGAVAISGKSVESETVAASCSIVCFFELIDPSFASSLLMSDDTMESGKDA